MHLLSMPLPSLMSLEVQSVDENLHALRGSLESVANSSPNLSHISISPHRSSTAFNIFFSSYICWWNNLQTVECDSITLEADAIVHLSRMPMLTRLAFVVSSTLVEQITSSNSPNLFPNLNHLTLYSVFLGPISEFLSCIHLPTVLKLSVIIDSCPFKTDISDFFASIKASGICSAIQDLTFEQKIGPTGTLDLNGGENPCPVLAFEDLQPCMEYRDLCRIDFDVGWDVKLTSSDVLALTSTWPYLETLAINRGWGWIVPSGITPDGLLQLLQTCPALAWITLAIDTRGYTECPQTLAASLGSTFPRQLSINVVDSIIGAESVQAVAAFFAAICNDVYCSTIRREQVEQMARWEDVGRLVRGAIGRGS